MKLFNEKEIERFGLFLTYKIDFGYQNFAIFDNFYASVCKT